MLNVDELIKESLKTKNTPALRVYRNLKTDIMVFKTQKNAPEYDEAAELKIIQKYAAKMEDAEKQYLEARRDDLVRECREELDILKTLLPEPVSTEKILDFIEHWAVSNGYDIRPNIQIPKKLMGTIIKDTKRAYPTVDGKMISDVIKPFLY